MLQYKTMYSIIEKSLFIFNVKGISISNKNEKNQYV